MKNINLKRRYSLAANPEDSIQQSEFCGIRLNPAGDIVGNQVTERQQDP